MSLATRAHLSGERIENLDAVVENFELTFIEFVLLAPNQLFESAQLLWAQTVATVTEEGFSESWSLKYAHDQRQVFLEQLRAYFGLPELHEKTIVVITTVNERNKRPMDPFPSPQVDLRR
jgi:hypothetical protein